MEGGPSTQFAVLSDKLLSEEPLKDAYVTTDVNSAALALALEEHEFRREKLEKELSTPPVSLAHNHVVPSDRPTPCEPRLTAPAPCEDLLGLIGTMDSAIFDGKRTLKQRLEAMNPIVKQPISPRIQQPSKLVAGKVLGSGSRRIPSSSNALVRLGFRARYTLDRYCCRVFKLNVTCWEMLIFKRISM